MLADQAQCSPMGAVTEYAKCELPGVKAMGTCWCMAIVLRMTAFSAWRFLW